MALNNRISLPADALQNLICRKCNKYLSVFPIYLQGDETSLCSRCTPPSSSKAIVNVPLENLLRHFRFPCSNKASGCLEYVLPGDDNNHEKICKFQFYKCPMNNEIHCTWSGLFGDILDHFEDKHPTSIIQDEPVVLNFTQSNKRNYLLTFEADLFIVIIEYNVENEVLSCALAYIGCSNVVETYSYELKLRNSCSNADPYVVTNNISIKALVNIGVWLQTFKNPSVTTVEISIKASQTNVHGEVSCENKTNKNILDMLECPVCYEHMVPPILMCSGGHSFCRRCVEAIDNNLCPCCHQEFTSNRNFALESVTNCILYPCKHEKCNFSTNAAEIKQHEEQCAFGPFKCPLRDYEGCKHTSVLDDLYDHIKQNHYENLLEVNLVQMAFCDTEVDEDCFILKYYNDLFQLHYKYADNTFYWSMQQIGSKGNAPYKFEIDVLDNSGNNLRVYLRANCAPMCDKDSCFEYGKTFLTLNLNQIRDLIFEDFSYRVDILKY